MVDSNNNNRVNILFATSDDPNKIGCGFYRVLWPSYWLARLFRDRMSVIFTDALFDFDVPMRDIFFFSRQVKPDVVDFVMKMKQETNGSKFVVVDFDDHLNAIPPHIPSAYKYYSEHKEHLHRMLRLADLLVFTHDNLARQLITTTGIRKPYILLPNAVDTRMQQPHPSDTDIIRIGWFGSFTHKYDLAMIRGVLEEVFKAVKDRVSIELITFGPAKQLIAEHLLRTDNPPFRWVHLDWLSPIDYLNRIVNLGIHIGLAPLEDTPFNRCKSNLKLLEYTLSGAVFLASDVYPYSETFTAHKQHTHCKNRFNEWVKKLTNLILNHQLRKEIHETLKQSLAQEYDCQVVYKRFGEELLNSYYQWLKGR